MTGRGLTTDDRGVSIAITHVLTIGITAILITGLLTGAGTLLQTERERAATESLTTVGERLSGQISSVDRVGQSSDVYLRTTHPRRIAGSRYLIDLTNNCDSQLVEGSQVTKCLRMTSTEEDVERVIPLKIDANIDTTARVAGGPIVIEYSAGPGPGTIEIRSGSI